MSLAELQFFLARLYTDDDLRREFLSAPEKIGRKFDLTKQEIDEIMTVFPEEISFFADSLFFKRIREVEKLLPRTKQILQKNFETHFRAFSQTFLPITIKKHLEDAVHFADYLIKQNVKPEWSVDLIRYEQANLIFHGCGKTFLFRRFKFNVKQFSRKPENPQNKSSVAIWLRIGSKTRHFIW